MSSFQVLLAGSFAIISNPYLSSGLSVWDDLATGYDKNNTWDCAISAAQVNVLISPKIGKKNFTSFFGGNV